MNKKPNLFLAQLAGAYALISGLLSFLGWVAGIQRLTDWAGNGITIKANTALAVCVAGVALLITPYAKGRTALRCLASFVAAVGALTFFEHLSGVSLGIDTLLFDEPAGASATVAPGRMGPPAAISFTLLGMALWLSTFQGRPRKVAMALGIVIVAIALLSLTGYAYGAHAMYTVPRLTGIAMQTATMLGALGFGLMAAVPEHDPTRTLLEDSSAGALARRLLPLVVLVPLLIGWLRLHGQQAGLYDTEFGAAMRTVIEVALLSSLLFWGLRALRSGEAARQEVAEKLRESERQLSSALESISDGLVTLDADWRFTYANSEAERLLGRKRADLLGRVIWQLFPEMIGTSVERDLRRAAGERITLEVEGLNPYTQRYFLNRIYPGIPEGVAIYFHDITQRKLAEDSLREADRRKDQFLATLAHELRNPLAPIRNASRIISLKSPGDPQLKWGAEVIGRQVQHMSRLLDDLLDVSRISRNRLELRKEWSDLATLVESAIETSRPVIESNQHAFRVQLPTPAIYVDADPVRMGQVFSNLLNNAAKYTPAGGQIELSAARDGNDAVVSIKDNGIGIAPDHIDHVFEIFWQDSSAAAHAQGGLGIGLSLAKGLVELHGGQIVVHSAGVGCGVEVRVRLPAVREEILAVAAPTENSMTASKPLRVLIVDDLKDNADTLCELLRSMGHQAFVAYDGSSAIGLAEKLQPDAILLDIGLPSPDGLEVCRRIRSEPWGKSILIAAVTGWGQEGDRARTLQAGFDRHFTKPVEPALLAQFLQSPAR